MVISIDNPAFKYCKIMLRFLERVIILTTTPKYLSRIYIIVKRPKIHDSKNNVNCLDS